MAARLRAEMSLQHEIRERIRLWVEHPTQPRACQQASQELMRLLMDNQAFTKDRPLQRLIHPDLVWWRRETRNRIQSGESYK